MLPYRSFNRSLKLFINTAKEFSYNNWWVFIIYFLLILLIFQTNRTDFLKVVLISTCHFISDIFVMMMISAYSRKEYALGTYFQIVSFLIFLSLKIDAGINGEFHYLAADPIYLLAAIKNYLLDTKEKNIAVINPISMTALSLIIIILILSSTLNDEKVWTTPGEIIQSMGIFLFAIGLTVTRNESIRFNVSIIALSAMAFGSSIELFNSITQINNSVTGLELSYILLPLTVLIFLLKSIFFQKKVSD